MALRQELSADWVKVDGEDDLFEDEFEGDLTEDFEEQDFEEESDLDDFQGVDSNGVEFDLKASKIDKTSPNSAEKPAEVAAQIPAKPVEEPAPVLPAQLQQSSSAEIVSEEPKQVMAPELSAKSVEEPVPAQTQEASPVEVQLQQPVEPVTVAISESVISTVKPETAMEFKAVRPATPKPLFTGRTTEVFNFGSELDDGHADSNTRSLLASVGLFARRIPLDEASLLERTRYFEMGYSAPSSMYPGMTFSVGKTTLKSKQEVVSYKPLSLTR